ncbi:MAG: type II toxin-antitoxin system RelE/ParE family toxin [Candidatus Brocadia sp.]|nr:type II toxin-antitoxin system RelE/ParE family toxin [Candidatus Brocadia sp.]
MGKIHWSKTAQRNLEEIADYIAQDSPFYAINFIERVLQDIEKLGDFPKIGRIVPEFKKENIREIIFHNYRIVYKAKIAYLLFHYVMEVLISLERQKLKVGKSNNLTGIYGEIENDFISLFKSLIKRPKEI